MKRLILSFALLVSATPLVVCAASYKDLQAALNSGALESGVYELSSDLTIAASAGRSAMTIRANQTVTLYLKNNATLTLTGGAASGTTGAGAGICLPASSSLYVTGEGTIVARGGNAANGGNGHGGENARFDDGWCNICEKEGNPRYESGCFLNGEGGAGGAGGGGAGAGIGGAGGDGGAAGARGYGDEVGNNGVRWDHEGKFHMPGANGGAGGNGTDGGSAGRFYVLGSVVVKATGGAAGANGQTGTYYGEHKSYISDDDWLAAGGAPGGGGQGGAAAEAIGYGGAGGAGGGGGGAGGFFQFDNVKKNTGYDCDNGSVNVPAFRPTRGRDGWEGSEVEPELAKTWDCYDGRTKVGSSHSGYGGKAGALAKNGATGELYSTPTTSFTLAPARAASQLENVAVNLPAVTLTFRDGDQVVGTKAVSLGAALPMPPACPTHEGECFLGWYLDDLCCYDAAGVAVLSASPLLEDVSLQAKWTTDASVLEVTDLAGFKKAIQALAADATLVGKSGQRRVTFKDAPVIELSEKLEIPASVGKLQLLGPATLRSNSGVELDAGKIEVYAENLTIENLEINADKLTLFNVKIVNTGADVIDIYVNELLASSTTLDSVKIGSTKSLIVNSTVIGASYNTEAVRFINVTKVGGAEIGADRFVNSLSVPVGTELKEYPILGVTHKYVEPTAAALEGAVEIYYDPTGENIAKLEKGEKVAIVGHTALATRCLTLDQLGSVRKTPTKGAIRIISEQPTLAIEAKTADGRYVVEKLPVALETTAVDIPGGSRNAEVVTTPYALSAVTVDVLNSETDLMIKGDAEVALAEASGIVATNLVVNGESFTANSLDAMKRITLEDASLAGGELQWFGSAGLVKADLNAKTFSGGRDYEKTDPMEVSACRTRTVNLPSVESDSLAQIAVTTTASARIRVRVISSGHWWTELTPVGSSGKTVTKIYTIPLRAGEHPIVEVKNDALTISDPSIEFSLTAHYITFGVEE